MSRTEFLLVWVVAFLLGAVVAGSAMALGVTIAHASAPRPALRQPAPSVALTGEAPAPSSGERTGAPVVLPLPVVAPASLAVTAAPAYVPGVRSPMPAPSATPQPTTRPKSGPHGPEWHGVASYVRASLGASYMAARMPKGTRLRVCGPAGCITGTVNDYGPSRRIFPGRIVDLSAHSFGLVCGPLRMGVCAVTVVTR